MNLIERYIYAVTHYLPESQRDDIAKELSSLIADMLDERVQDGQATEKHIEEVLLELGEPRELAEKYRGSKRYLIGPELFDQYVMVLKITLITLSIVIGVTFIIRVILDPPSILESFISGIVSLVTALPTTFGWLTLVYAMVQMAGGKQLHKKRIKSWRPSDLPAVPHPKAKVKKREAITSMIFYTICLAFFIFSSDYLGVWLKDHGKSYQVIPVFNEDHHVYFILLIVLTFGFGIIRECMKLIFGRWTMKLVLYTAIVDCVSIIGLLFVLAEREIWNPNFMNQLVESGTITAHSDAYKTISMIWEQATVWVLILFLIGLLWDLVEGLIKARKGRVYSNS